MISASTLNSYLNKHMSMICPNGYDKDNINHCAHFVGHVLDITVGKTCLSIVHGTGAEGSIRVNEIFNLYCPLVGEWKSKPSSLSRCLIFITSPTNVTLSPKHMTDHPTKHIGIFVGGRVWHYSNGRHKVVSVPVNQMKKHYSGQTDDWLFYGTLR